MELCTIPPLSALGAVANGAIRTFGPRGRRCRSYAMCRGSVVDHPSPAGFQRDVSGFTPSGHPPPADTQDPDTICRSCWGLGWWKLRRIDASGPQHILFSICEQRRCVGVHYLRPAIACRTPRPRHSNRLCWGQGWWKLRGWDASGPQHIQVQESPPPFSGVSLQKGEGWVGVLHALCSAWLMKMGRSCERGSIILPSQSPL
jgi:hypothetical protein